MARTRSGGPGSVSRHGVSGTMNAPFAKAAGSRQGVGGGQYGANKAPFSKPQDTGSGGIPTKFFDGTSAKVGSSVNAGRVSPPIGSTQAVGTRRFKNPR